MSFHNYRPRFPSCPRYPVENGPEKPQIHHFTHWLNTCQLFCLTFVRQNHEIHPNFSLFSPFRPQQAAVLLSQASSISPHLTPVLRPVASVCQSFPGFRQTIPWKWSVQPFRIRSTWRDGSLSLRSSPASPGGWSGSTSGFPLAVLPAEESSPGCKPM